MHTLSIARLAFVPSFVRATDDALAAANEAAIRATAEAAKPDVLAVAAAASIPTIPSTVTISVPKRVRKLTGAAVKPVAAKPGKPVAAKPAKPGKAKPEAGPDIHGTRGTYTGASPSFRGHGKRLSPIVLDRIPGTYTDRDNAFLHDLYAAYGTKPFARRDADAGAISRLIGHGALHHVSGELDMRDCKFAVTAKAVKTRLAKAVAPKA